MHASQIRAGRGLLKWTQSALAEKSGISVPTIKRLEAMKGALTGHTATISALESCLVDAGVQFLEFGTEAEGQGVCLRDVD